MAIVRRQGDEAICCTNSLSGMGDCFVTAAAQRQCFVPRNDGAVRHCEERSIGTVCWEGRSNPLHYRKLSTCRRLLHPLTHVTLASGSQ